MTFCEVLRTPRIQRSFPEFILLVYSYLDTRPMRDPHQQPKDRELPPHSQYASTKKEDPKVLVVERGQMRKLFFTTRGSEQ